MKKQKIVIFFFIFLNFFVKNFSSEALFSKKSKSPLELRANSNPKEALIEEQRRITKLEKLAFGGTPSNARPDSEGGDSIPKWHNLHVLLKGHRKTSIVQIPATERITYYRRKNGGEWKRLPNGAQKSPHKYEFKTQEDVIFDRQRRLKNSDNAWEQYDNEDNSAAYDYRVIARMHEINQTKEIIPSLTEVLKQQHEDLLVLHARIKELEAELKIMQQELEEKKVLSERPEPKYTGQRSPQKPIRKPSFRTSANDFWHKILNPTQEEKENFNISSQRAYQHTRSESPTKLPPIVNTKKK